MKKELFNYPEGDIRRPYALDAIAFYLNRIAELLKFIFTSSSETFQNLCKKIAPCFQEHRDDVRESVHTKCESLLETLPDNCPYIDLAARWEPYVNKNYHYPANALIWLIRERLKDLEKMGLKVLVHDVIDLYHLNSKVFLIKKYGKDGYGIVMIPLRLAERNYGCLAIKFQNESVCTFVYHSLDASLLDPPNEVRLFCSFFGDTTRLSQAEEREIAIEDHGPLLVERSFQIAQLFSDKDKDEIGPTLEVRKRHLRLALEKGFPEIYLDQFFRERIFKL